MQLSSPHADDDTDIKSEELPETSLFHLVGTETENEVCYKNAVIKYQ
jgi:hypothetical protein